MDYFVYVLKSLKRNILYKGSTRNIDRRLREHINGSCQTTRHLRPLFLVFVQICSSKSESVLLERYIKSGFGREIIQELLEF